MGGMPPVKLGPGILCQFSHKLWEEKMCVEHLSWSSDCLSRKSVCVPGASLKGQYQKIFSFTYFSPPDPALFVIKKS
jgi:hypothetical protein